MSGELPFRGDHMRAIEPYEIQLGISFKPFEDEDYFLNSEEGTQEVSIPESYDPILKLRKKVRFHGTLGYIDVISEDFGSIYQRVEKPLGDTSFHSIFRGPGKMEHVDYPTILRFSFIVQNPAQYVVLLNSYVDIVLGDERYLLAWKVNTHIKQPMQQLQAGKEQIVVEKNLINYKLIEEAERDGIDEGINGELGGPGSCYPWLPSQLAPLRTIDLTFRHFDHGEDFDQHTAPVTPNRIPVLA